MKIYEAVVEVLKQENQALSVKEIYQKIVAAGLFKFSAKDPVAVAAKSIRLRTQGERNSKSDPLFMKTGDGKYQLLKDQ